MEGNSTIWASDGMEWNGMAVDFFRRPFFRTQSYSCKSSYQFLPKLSLKAHPGRFPGNQCLLWSKSRPVMWKGNNTHVEEGGEQRDDGRGRG